jgi:GT2 family glycosyltransferase/glycosyltransferase involved in cell wall biosynthesis
MTAEQRHRRQALLVIGMHRSGTSALTRVVNLHGVTLGSELPEAAFDNEAGFWENQQVVNLHERLLADLGSSWDDPRELREGWLGEAATAGYLDQLVTLIASDFGDALIWAVKDPRLCRLLPLWLKALSRLDIEPKLIFALRHPGEVVGSLMRRNDLSAAEASLLWLRHLWESVQASQTVLRCAVDYDDLLAGWRSCMDRVASELAVEWPVPSQACAVEIDAHLLPDLRHQHSSATQDLLPPAWRDLLLEVHAAGLAVARGGASWDSFESKLHAAATRFTFARPLIADLLPKSGQDRLQARLIEAELAREAYQAEAKRLFDESTRAQIAQQAEAQARDKAEQAREALHAEAREALRAELIESRGEVVKRNARIHVLEHARTELELIKASRSWRWTRSMRLVMRTISNRGLSALDRRRIMRLLSGDSATDFGARESTDDSSVADESSPALHSGVRIEDVALAAPSGTQRDFFMWAVIDWHFRTQRPQHLARELAAAGHRVFYISNNFIDRREPGFSVESLDSEGRLFQIHLHLQGSPVIYHASPDAKAQTQLRADVGMLLAWTRSVSCASLIQHPYWLETAQILPNQRIIYDCMDHHGGFADNSQEVLAREHELMRDADLLVVTSDWLHAEAGKYNPRRLMIRNACQYEHFATRSEQIFKDPSGRKVIGYYGAIAEWFDLDLLEKVARRFSDCLVLLVGADTSGAQQRLQALGNVEFTGEVPYARLPYYLEGFDVCLLPFQVIPLTLATNPVKVYEYLSAGKEVVSIDLPEIRQFGELVRTGSDHASFLDAVDAALVAEPDPVAIARRQQFAAEQTWAHRVHDLVQGIEALPEPRVSVVVVTYNNLDLTKACLQSLEQFSDYANLEVIVVDNASADDTPAYLQAWAAAGDDRRLVLNADNRGFAAANNQGLALATGEYLVMLNNDTYVTPGWVATLVWHLRRDPKLGMLGPVTNNIGNEARIDIRYDNMNEMLPAAADYTSRHAGQLTPLRTAAFFCVMLRRSVFEKVGPLDEAFGIGFFEDDDYCRRVEQAGWSIACADDVFIHHNLSASFNKLKQETRMALFEQNKVTYEAKWGTWVPHKYRDG